jgi:16S rRNA (cytidine1402-2'-O)-methyltransferase
VAGPGAVIVKLAHEKRNSGYSLVGPSFFGNDGIRNERTKFYISYLPIGKDEKKSSFKTLERVSSKKNQSPNFHRNSISQ